MRWRLLLFTAQRRGVWQRAAVLCLFVSLVIITHALRPIFQPAELTLTFPNAQFVSAVGVYAPSGLVAAASVTTGTHSVQFHLSPGDYVIRATPSSLGYQQHWYLPPLSVRVPDSKTVRIAGTYGGG
ncbi:MAG: hypothetical protein M1296_01785 [Chloroflexi bacterium]|nr:hypothetical protein [Chloroflexota bacterium]